MSRRYTGVLPLDHRANSTNTSPVDVLAVMDHAQLACEAHTARTVYVSREQRFKRVSENYGLPEARTAVAELIEAAQPFATFNSSLERIRIEVRTEEVRRLRTALARVKGGAA